MEIIHLLRLAPSAVPAEVADLPQPRLAAGGEGYDPGLAAAQVRAGVEGEVRREADEAMRGVIARVKVRVTSGGREWAAAVMQDLWPVDGGVF